MDLHHTGSNKIFEVHSNNVSVVIKSKKPIIYDKLLSNQNSKLRITGLNIDSIKILGEEKISTENILSNILYYELNTCPLFFEQADYEVIVRSNNGEDVSVWHENYSIRDKIGPVLEDNKDLVSGIINFGNSAGFSDLEILLNNHVVLTIKLEVFPTKISYKEDYQAMLQDISDVIYEAILDFMRNTYQEFSIGNNQATSPALFFEIIKKLYTKFKNALDRIIKSPHHKLYLECPVVAAHKVKKTNSYTVKWLNNHPQFIHMDGYKINAIKAPTIKKQITFNTIENQFVKFILKVIVEKLKDFRQRYIISNAKCEEKVLKEVDRMSSELSRIRNISFLKDVEDYKATQSMSLVFEMAPGYRELYKYYLMMMRGLSINGDVFKMSLKDTAQLYEYWCFIKLVKILKSKYRLASSDIIKVENKGVTITLVKGKKSEVLFINPRTGEKITISYNPGEQNTQTVNQKPDNVLTLQKLGTDVEYKYIFDAKYRIENNPSDPYYPDKEIGPKVEDINTMHRYRDSIVYENIYPSKFMFEKTMFGAYVLFPYNDPENKYVNHRFYKSIETVNIGGLPFLPGTTKLVEEFLSELVADSEESAFERASMPRGIEEKLLKVDWSVRDVMVGTVRTREQLKYNIEECCYYAPKKFVEESNLPIRFIALYEDNVSNFDGIVHYGEVITTSTIKRKEIPVAMRNNGEEIYYYFKVKNWKKLNTPITIKDSLKGKPKFTNKFLLDNCSESYQLFNIHSNEEYRLMTEINKAFENAQVHTDGNDNAVYCVDEEYTICLNNGKFMILKTTGEILDGISITDFERNPKNIFNKIKNIIQGN